MTVHHGSAAEIRFLAALLARGEAVAVPTETVYGLAAHALDPAACRRIFEIKGRPLLDPLIVHVLDSADAARWSHWEDRAECLAAALWPGPLTLVLPKREAIPGVVTAGRPTVALRAPRHPLARALLAECGFPLAAPSANPFGCLSPTRPEHVREALGDRVAHLLDGGPCEVGLESTILSLVDEGGPVVLRPGVISAESLAAVLGEPVRVRRSEPGGEILAPGMLERHYSPRTPLGLFQGASPAVAAGECVVWLRRPVGGTVAGRDFWLSEDGDWGECARHLYDLLHRLDQLAPTRLWLEVPAEATGIAAAYLDRVRRAAAPGL